MISSARFTQPAKQTSNIHVNNLTPYHHHHQFIIIIIIIKTHTLTSATMATTAPPSLTTSNLPSATTLRRISATSSYSPSLRPPTTHRPRLRLRLRLKPTKITATIAVGDTLPESTFSYFDSDGELQTTTVSDLTKSKTTILFAVPGAFTPTCSQKHLPGFVEKSGELKSKGVNTIACVSVNDAFVMKAWKADLKIGDDVMLLSDGNGEFTKAIGCEMDLSDNPIGLGVRSRRYAMLVEDGVVKVLNLEEGGAFTASSAEDMLAVL